MRHDDPDDLLRLPSPPATPSRPAVPLLTAVVPVIGAVVLWQLTGSVHALWFAALGPLLAAASFVDGLRGARRAGRRATRQAAGELEVLSGVVAQRHAQERERAWARTPDVVGYAADAEEVWRVVPGRDDVLVLGRGEGASSLGLTGEPHDEAARAVRRRARVIDDLPVTVPLGAGVAVCGPPVLAAAVVRALAVQVCLSHAPGRVRQVIAASADIAADDSHMLVPPLLPHGEATQGAVMFVGEADRPIPGDVDIPIVRLAVGAPSPPRCAAVLTIISPEIARLDYAGTSRQVRVEAISHEQARAVAEALSTRAATLGQRLDGAVTFAQLSPVSPVAGSLATPIGMSAGQPVVIDLVADGPHAVVVGVTGSGKSELLTTWVAGMCRGRSVQEVSFLLVDFKGGRTFDALSGLPHVTGVLTDLDDGAALRAIDSLRAEVRHRERVLAAHGARDVDEAGAALARLVIVVDEYAALVAAHSGLHELFADIAARGRALGMHLILASQRVGGAFRDAVLANAPLRVAFRVTDAADSRAVLGSDDAAHLPGSSHSRGTALIRRAADAGALRARVARCDNRDIAAIAAACGDERARAPWLPALPALLPLAALRTADERVLGRADEPDRQRQPPLLLDAASGGFCVIGSPGSGRTTLLRVVAAQADAALWVPRDAEQAWDAAARLDDLAGGTTVLIDDLDTIMSRLPPEYAAEWLARLERAAREARGRGLTIVVSVGRTSGMLSRVIDLLPHRAVLGLASRADHVAAGGEAADFIADLPAGRGRWGRRLVQFAHIPSAPAGGACEESAPPWMPGGGPAALVVQPGPAAAAVGDECARHGIRVIAVEEVALAASPEQTLMPGTVVCGSPEAWLASWRLLTWARAAADLVVGADCAAEYRAVTGRRELPPYALAGARRAWRHVPGGGAERVLLPHG